MRLFLILVFAIASVALGLWAYEPMQSARWVMEDSAWWASAVPLLHFRWLTVWSWQWTQTPASAHLCNLLLHTVISLLSGILAYRLGLSALTAGVASVFLFMHPMAVETVAYAASRSELIAALGVIGACLAVTGRRWWAGPLAVVLVGVGLLGKESAIVAVGLIPLTLWMTHRPWQKTALVGVGIGGLCIALYFQSLALLINFGDYANEIGWGRWVLMQSVATFRMLLVLVTGSGMTPDADYDRVSLVAQVMSLGWLFGLGICAWVYRAKARLVTFALGWMLLSIAPRFIVQTPGGYFNEHQFYTPRIGLLIGAAALVMEVGRRLALRWSTGLWWDAPESA